MIMPPAGGFDSVPIIVLYIGPDQIMPLTSVLGAFVGLALMFWNHVVGLARKWRTLLGRRSQAAQKSAAD